MRPAVSVIVPVYRAERFLAQCVESVLAQSRSDLELLLIDDGSPDGSGSLCDGYARLDARVRVIHQQNAGVSAARNAGLERAAGDYIAFVDADDWVEPDWLESMLAALDGEPGADICACGHLRHEDERTEDRSARLCTGFLSPDEAFCSALRGGIDGYCWNKLFYAPLFKELRFDPAISVLEDLLLCQRAILQSRGVVCLPRPLYHYRIHGLSALHQLDKRLSSEPAAWAELLRLASGSTLREDSAVFGFVQQTNLNARRADLAGKREEAAQLRASLRPCVRRALTAGTIPTGERGKLALKLAFPALISERYL